MLLISSRPRAISKAVWGSGYCVSKVSPERSLQVAPRRPEKATDQRKRPARFSNYGQRVQLFGGYENRPIRAFRANLPALDLFPTHTLDKNYDPSFSPHFTARPNGMRPRETRPFGMPSPNIWDARAA